MLRLLRPLTTLLGLVLLTANAASAFAFASAENRASGSAAVAEHLVGNNTRLSEKAIRENIDLRYDFASDSPVAAEGAAASRGLSSLGGVFSSETNAVGGEVWTSVGNISQNDVASIVNSGMYSGDVNIISGVHGFIDGSTSVDLSLYEADVARFGNLPGVNVYNFSELAPGQLNGFLNGPGTTIGGFCNSGICLAPFR
jgi:hypothetical protein